MSWLWRHVLRCSHPRWDVSVDGDWAVSTCTRCGMAVASPASPAPCIGNDPTCPCQDGDACHYVDAPGSPAWPTP